MLATLDHLIEERTEERERELLPTRASLLSRIRDGQDDSWQEFFETYWKLIYAFAVKAGCTDVEAEEVVQETIISVSRKMPDFHYNPAVCSFKGWLMHVANWRVIDQLRKRNHKLVHPEPETSTAATAFWSIEE